jgi:hypothetical protein
MPNTAQAGVGKSGGGAGAGGEEKIAPLGVEEKTFEKEATSNPFDT